MELVVDYPNNQDEAAAAEWMSTAEAGVSIALLSILSITGTAGNALVLCVFSRRKDRQVSTLFILSLAMVDFSTCLFVVPFTVYMESVDFRVDVDPVCKLYHFLITCNIPFSAMVMVAIAVDRYFCICHPWMNVVTVDAAKGIVVGLGATAIVLGGCVACMYGIYHQVLLCPYPPCNESAGNSTTPVLSSAAAVARWPCIAGQLRHDFDCEGCLGEGLPSNLSSSYEELCVLSLAKTSKCETTTLLLSTDFQYLYHKLHMSMYVVCFLAVSVLYLAIYRSVMKRRSRRRRRCTLSTDTQHLAMSRSAANAETQAPQTTATLLGLQVIQSRPSTVKTAANSEGSGSSSSGLGLTRLTSYDGNFVANLKTAAMLFVVTLVFMLTFLPAWLMIMELVPFSTTLFYLYFANSAANPLIYSFMNRNFRDSLQKLLRRSNRQTTTTPTNQRSQANQQKHKTSTAV